MSIVKYIPIIIPALFGYGIAMLCKVNKNSGSSVIFRPPAIVFSLVWPILYLFLGLSWYYARKDNNILIDIFYSILVILLCGWVFTYSCINNKKLGIYMIVLSIIFASLCYTLTDNKTSKLLIVPLIGWLFFATLLNVFEVQNK